MTSRIESAARDYAIALVAARRLHGMGDVLRRIDLRLARDVEDAEDEVCETPWQLDGIRLVRARLALYLRLVRRADALERWEASPDADSSHADAWAEWLGWAIPHLDGRVWCYRTEWRFAAVKAGYAGTQPRYPRPLWLDAPPFEAGVTARMRRERDSQACE